MTPSSPLLQFIKWEKETPNEIFLQQPFDGIWKTWTWAQAGDEARRLAAGLHTLGLKRGDHIAILSKNCSHWIISDLAIMMAGCISIPIYPSLSAAGIKPILVHSDTKAIIIGKLDDFSQQNEGIPTGTICISVTNYGTAEKYRTEELIANNAPLQNVYNWQAKDIFTIIYTSGTTGNSKGVMHTISAFDTIVPLVVSTLKMPLKPRLFSYLPLCHIAERMAIEMYGIYFGAVISFAENITSFSKNLIETEPELFFGVPRIWGKLREGILKKIPQKKLNILLAIPLLNTIIKNSIRKKLGLAKATHIYSAAAPLAPELQKWFINLNIPIRQAYGMTEDCVYAHFDSPTQYRIGKVGRALPGLLVKFTVDGELCVKSNSNMVGYYKEPALTAEMFDEDNYLKTGDIAEYDADCFLSITGRIKDQFKTDKGKYISPSPIEMQLLANTKIEQVCVVGTGIPQPIALITLTEEGSKNNKEEIVNELTLFLKLVNRQLEGFEKLEKLVIIDNSWSIENGLLTPTLKVKRNEIEKMHLLKYPVWYADKEVIIWEK